MIINGIKLPPGHTKEQLSDAIKKKCGFKPYKYRICKKSVDARFNRVSLVYNIEAVKQGEEFDIPPRIKVARSDFRKRPVVVGAGPCGLFAAYILAVSGARPILIERGKSVDDRIRDVENFWNNRQFNPTSNVQFGEGGAGTFSDGKLTTQISDPLCAEVLHTFVECGADEDILYTAKPHLGTDKLVNIVKNLRNKITELGGEVHFEETLRGVSVRNGRIEGISANTDYDTDCLILAIGHSARDTFEMLHDMGVPMIAKAFSVGARIEHPQADVDRCQYGDFAGHPSLGAADYKLSYHTESGRGVYTFCMCPGGVVVAAASEENSVVTNGMSYYARNGRNANSAFLVSVTPDDFGKKPLDGVAFQREIESRAYHMAGANYNAPCQLLGDFVKGEKSSSFGSITPTFAPGVTMADMNDLFPQYVTDAMKEAVPQFARRLKCFDMTDAVLTGPETRSSSPVRIVRDETLQSSIEGLYPAGEGAGYAGGIMSAAVDGIRCALAAIENNR